MPVILEKTEALIKGKSKIGINCMVLGAGGIPDLSEQICSIFFSKLSPVEAETTSRALSQGGSGLGEVA